MTNPRPRPCHTCRRQRLRCDGHQPGCKRCLLRRVECLGYGEKPLLWVAPRTQSHDIHQTADRDTGSQVERCLPQEKRAKPKGRPKLVLMPPQIGPNSDEAEDEEILGVLIRWYKRYGQLKAERDPTGRPILPLAPSINPSGYEADRLAISSLMYLNAHMLVDLADLLCVDASENPHQLPTEYWCYYPDMILDLVISVTMTHQLIKSQGSQCLLEYPDEQGVNGVVVRRKSYSLGSVHHPNLPAIYKHNQNALEALGKEIKDPETQYSDLTLNMVVMLLRVEIQQSAFSAWPIHLEAAKAIIAHRGSMSSLAGDTHANLEFCLVSVLLIDIMSCVTTPTGDLAKHTAKQQEYIPLLPRLFKDGLSIGFPCANTLVESIIRINRVRYFSSITQHYTTKWATVAEKLLCQIAEFDPATWAETQRGPRRYAKADPGGSSKEAITPNTSDHKHGSTRVKSTERYEVNHCQAWVDLARAQKISVLLYCLQCHFMQPQLSKTIPELRRTLNADDAADEILRDVSSLRELALKALLEALHRLWGADAGCAAWQAKFSFWPLFIAGLEITPQKTTNEKSFICRSLYKLVAQGGDMGPADAVSVLETFWEWDVRGVNGGTMKKCWSDDFSRIASRGIFF